MSEQGVMTTPIFDELVAELGHELGQLTTEADTDTPQGETDAA
jgi:hypothetical protein